MLAQQELTWSASNEACAAYGMQLASFRDGKELKWVLCCEVTCRAAQCWGWVPRLQ